MTAAAQQMKWIKRRDLVLEGISTKEEPVADRKPLLAYITLYMGTAY